MENVAVRWLLSAAVCSVEGRGAVPEGRICADRVSLQCIWQKAVPCALIPAWSHSLFVFGSAKGCPSLQLHVEAKACAGTRQKEAIHYFAILGCMCAKQCLIINLFSYAVS